MLVSFLFQALPDAAVGELFKNLSTYDRVQLAVVVLIIVLVLAFLFARFFLASGTERLGARQEDRKDAVSILQSQLKAMWDENHEQDKRIAEKDRRIHELDHELRNCQTARAGLEWMKDNPAMLRAKADEIEASRQKPP